MKERDDLYFEKCIDEIIGVIERKGLTVQESDIALSLIKDIISQRTTVKVKPVIVLNDLNGNYHWVERDTYKN